MDYLEEDPKTPTPPPGPIRVYLLVDSRLSREALTRVLRRFPDISVVGQGQRPDEADEVRAAVEASVCDLLVLDTPNPEPFLVYPGTHPPQTAKPKILLIGMSSDPDQFLAAVRSGVSGYLLKDASASEIVVAIRTLAHGEAHCPPKLCLKLFQHIAQQGHVLERESGSITSLTLRQHKLVKMVAEGLTNKEIASNLNLSEFTVRNHMHRIMRRLKAANRREVVASVQALDRQYRQTWGRTDLHQKSLQAEILSENAQPKCTQARSDTIQQSAIQSLRYVEGSHSKNRQQKGESR